MRTASTDPGRYRLSRTSKIILVVAPLIVAIGLAGAYIPLPYVIYRPGPTINVLGDLSVPATDAAAAETTEPIIGVDGHEEYRDDGELRMVTVSVTTRDAKLGFWDVLDGWLDKDAHVYDRDVLYPEQSTQTQEDDEQQGQLQMESSQEAAVAVAMKQLGYDLDPAVKVVEVGADAPAEGILEAGDEIETVEGQAVSTTAEAVAIIKAQPLGDPVELGISRGGAEQTVEVTPGERDGQPYLGITVGLGYDFPFDVHIDIDPAIGGPSAGLIFTLGIYDVLTPGSLTGGAAIAGTGTMSSDGTVGPIGGIAQKIPAARDAGAKLFLVPAENCAEALTARAGDMKLVRVDTFATALAAVQEWVADPAADLPACSTGQ